MKEIRLYKGQVIVAKDLSVGEKHIVLILESEAYRYKNQQMYPMRWYKCLNGNKINFVYCNENENELTITPVGYGLIREDEIK